MVLEVYRSSFLSRAHERDQMDLLMKYLKAKFDTKDERCMVVIRAKIPVTLHGEVIHYEFDVIVFKDNKIVAIDLKNVGGRIRANCFPGSYWEADDGQGFTQVPGKPFDQARYHRIDLCRFLQNRLLSKGIDYKKAEGEGGFWEIPRYLDEHVGAWVATAEGSKPKPEGLTYIDARWFKVLPFEEVARRLEFEREGRLLTDEQFQEFLKLMDAIRVPWDEWHRGLGLEQVPQDRQPKNRIISGLLNAGSHENLLEALSYIRRLDMRQYVPEVKDCLHNREMEDIRLESLKVLMEWEVEDLGTLLMECLTDPSPQIVSFVLGYLCRVSVPEAFPALAIILRNGPADYAPAAITAITLLGHPEACDSIFDFAKRKFSPDGFQILKDWSEALHSRKEITREEYYSGKRVMFIDLETQLRNHLALFRVTCEALGTLNCAVAASWLEDLLVSPRRIGIDRDSFPDYGEDHVTNCHAVFSAALDGLSRMRNCRIVPLLLERLAQMSEDYRESIVWALGNIGDSSASKPLVEYLEKGPEYHRDATIHALGSIGGDDAFDAVAKHYVTAPTGQSGYWAGKELVRISPERAENLLLREIGSNPNEEFKGEFLRVLLPIATPTSVELMISLLRNPLHSAWASEVLGKLSTDRKVFRRIMQLTRSENPLEQASAILALGDYYIDHLDELAVFEGKGTPVEVRRAVTVLYHAAKATERLRKYAEDSDSEVRSNVFLAMESKGRHYGHFFVSSDSGPAEGCALVVTPEELITRLRLKIGFTPLNVLECAVLTKTEDNRYGLYIRAKHAGKDKSCLLVPTWPERYDGEENRLIRMLLNDILKAAPREIRRSLTEEDTKIAGSLWAKVPSDLSRAEEEYWSD
jgi:HEAT repeat protein